MMVVRTTSDVYQPNLCGVRCNSDVRLMSTEHSHNISTCARKNPVAINANPISDWPLPPNDSTPPGVISKLRMKPLINMPYKENILALAYSNKVVAPAAKMAAM